jgi:hypothetical protein
LDLQLPMQSVLSTLKMWVRIPLIPRCIRYNIDMFSPIDLKYDNIFQNIYNVVQRPIDCKKLVIYTTYFTRVAEYLNRKFSQRFGLELGLSRKRHWKKTPQFHMIGWTLRVIKQILFIYLLNDIIMAGNRHKQNSWFCKECREDNFRFWWRRIHEDASQGMYIIW